MRIAHPTRSLSSFAQHHFTPKPLFLGRFCHLLQQNHQTPALASAATRPTMANSENLSTISADEDAKFGFGRAEMYKEKLAGTVDSYDRHVFLCYKSPDDWPPRVEASDAETLPKLLASALKARKSDITVKTKLTICEAGDGSEFADGDVLIFPEMIKYKGLLTASDVDSFVDDVLVNGKQWASGVLEVLTGSHVFVCAHASRDKRCGVCGPVLIEKLKEGIESRGLTNQVFVSPCSHIGGHKYAGNMIIYSPDSEGKITGHWYGYVTPDDVPEFLDQHIGKGVVIDRLWRGQMGAPTEEHEKVDERKLPNGKDVKKSEKQEESNSQGNREIAGGCCQGANGFSCCRDGSTEVEGEKIAKETKEVHENKGLCTLSSWFGSWEQSDVLTAAAVVGAVATVAVAYGCYRRSG